MSNQNDGGPAFPKAKAVCAYPNERDGGSTVHIEDEGYDGMSLRDYFAAQALTGLIHEALGQSHEKWDATAQHAYIIADAMLKERERK